MSGYFIGIDIGATHCRVKCCDTDKKNSYITDKQLFKRFDTVREEIDYNVCSRIDWYIKNHGLSINNLKGIGIAVPALFDRNTGELMGWPNNPKWENINLKSIIEEKYSVPVIIEEDANSAAYGEYAQGSATGMENIIYITVSTGIGSGLILDGNLYIGHHGFAGEIGHIVIEEGGTECTCGKKGCFQALASGPAILKRYRSLKNDDRNYTLEEVFKSMEKGEKQALQCMEEVSGYLMKMIHFLVMLLDIECVVLGGGVVISNDYIFSNLLRKLREYEFYGRLVEVRKAKLGDDSGVEGILGLIYNKLEPVSI